MAKVQIIGAPQSTFVRTTRIAAEEQGIDYELMPAAPHTPAVVAIHPLGKIPVMRHGEVSLCESRAIIAYFERTFAGPTLTPADPLDACRVDQWVSMLQTAFLPVMQSDYLAAYFFAGTADGSPDRARIDQALPKLERYLAVVDGGLAATGHLGSPDFSLADAYLVPILHYLKDLPESAAMIAARPAISAPRPSAARKRPGSACS